MARIVFHFTYSDLKKVSNDPIDTRRENMPTILRARRETTA